MPAIVTPELWATAQERLKANRGDQTRNERRPDLLRGHVFCAICGRRMRGEDERGAIPVTVARHVSAWSARVARSESQRGIAKNWLGEKFEKSLTTRPSSPPKSNGGVRKA